MKSFASVEWFGNCWIDINCNYKPEEANGFLMVLHQEKGTRCTGGFERNHIGNDKYNWVVTHDCLPDEDGNDQHVVGYFESQEKAMEALWERRHHAAA